MKRKIFLIAIMTLIGMSNLLAQKPPFVQLSHNSTPVKSEPLYVETTKYLTYIPAKGREDKQIRYDRVSRMWLTFISYDSSNVEAWVYDYDPVGNMTKKMNVVMHLGVPERYGYYVYKFSYVTYTYDAANRLTSTKDHPPTTELFGEIITKIGDRLGWPDSAKKK